jgi:hypothetical protein
VMHGHEKSDPAILASNEADEQSRATGGGVGGAKGGGQGERDPAQHAPGAGPGKRVCTHVSIGERTGRNQAAAGIFRRRMAASARSQCLPWKTRSSNAQLLPC